MYPIGQIADYLAMLSLSMADAPGNWDRLPSVLDLMAERCPEEPETLTEADKAYLEGLYAMDEEEIGSARCRRARSRIPSSVRRTNKALHFRSLERRHRRPMSRPTPVSRGNRDRRGACEWQAKVAMGSVQKTRSLFQIPLRI